ncbi:MAG: hypothetical protein HN341_20020 [Verrucomicrobia bacterium]|jgi:hypothetical protein|nr:hypothetical protein [Verrucomicrobiota bacterium]
MANILMIALSLAVLATAGGVLFWFFRRLRRIEDELWGTQRQEAAETAQEAAETDAESADADEAEG